MVDYDETLTDNISLTDVITKIVKKNLIERRLGTNIAIDSSKFSSASATNLNSPANLVSGDEEPVEWSLVQNPFPLIVEYDFAGRNRCVGRYKLKAPSAQNARMPTAWTFEVWNGSNWVVKHSVTGATGWAANETRIYVNTDLTTFGEKGRFVFTAGGQGNRLRLNQVEMDVCVYGYILNDEVSTSEDVKVKQLSDHIDKNAEILDLSVSKSFSDEVGLVDKVSKKMSTILSDEIGLTDSLIKHWIHGKDADISLEDSVTKFVTKSPMSDEVSLVDLVSKELAKEFVGEISLDDDVSRTTKKVLTDVVSIIPAATMKYILYSYSTGRQSNAATALGLLKDKINTIDTSKAIHYVDLESKFGVQVTGVLIWGEPTV
jgi:hypothetical protein